MRLGLVAAVLALAGFAVGRMVGLAVDGSPRQVIYVLLTAELAGIVIAMVALNPLDAT